MSDSLFTPKSKAVQGNSNEGSKVRPQFVTVDGGRQGKPEGSMGHRKKQI